MDCLVCTAGGIEEDLMKCLAPSFLGAFSLPGKELRKKGINRIGNLLVPNVNYTKLEEWIIPIWNQMLEEQKTQVRLTGSLFVWCLCVVFVVVVVVVVVFCCCFF